jgi:hypothetical protein
MREYDMTDYNVPEVIVEVTQTVSSTALALADFTGITAANVDASSRLWLTVNSGSVRLYYGGTTPTTSAGHLVISGSDLLLSGSEVLAQFQVIRDGGSDATVTVTLEG